MKMLLKYTVIILFLLIRVDSAMALDQNNKNTIEEIPNMKFTHFYNIRKNSCEERLKKEGTYIEGQFLQKCNQFAEKINYKDDLSEEYKKVVELCLEDIVKPGSIEDQIKKHPTGLSKFSEDILEQLHGELYPHIKFKLESLMKFDYGQKKFLEIYFEPQLKSISWKERWMIYYFYDLQNNKFLGKEAGAMHGDY